jgi:hypothetical protein
MSLRGAIVKNLLFICLLLGLSVSNSASAQTVYKSVSVCEVLANTQTHHLRYVAINADLFIVRPDGMALFDKRCMKKGLGIDFPTPDADESVSNLERAIRDGQWPMESTGRFCGRIIRNAKSQRPILSLRSVLNLQPKGGDTSPPDVTNPTRMRKSPVPEIPHTVPPA